MKEKNIYQVSVDEVIRKYEISDLENGLTKQQVEESLKKYGLNKIESKKYQNGNYYLDNLII